MVGNDVVDLRDDDATPERAPRFDARVFSDDELRALDAAPERARLRWQLWAAKEAAYKVAVKRDPTTIFSPSRFRVRLGAEGCPQRGAVETPAGEVELELYEQAGAIHGIAREGGGRVIAAMTRLGQNALDASDPAAPGRHARRFAMAEIAHCLGSSPESLEIRKRGRVPELWREGRQVADLSLSHHGNVVGFACALDEPGGYAS